MPFSSRIRPRAKAAYHETPETAPETRNTPVRLPEMPSSIGRPMSRRMPGRMAPWITSPFRVSTTTTVIFAHSFGFWSFSGASAA
ncbi:hypothetical protein ACFQFG_18615 [Methylobacterium persicinum]